MLEGLMFSILDYRYRNGLPTSFATNILDIGCPRMKRRVAEATTGVMIEGKLWKK
jgi:hypothetical protein